MDGQAEMAPLSADDVAQFLIDNPEADGADDQQEQVPTDESPQLRTRTRRETETTARMMPTMSRTISPIRQAVANSKSPSRAKTARTRTRG